MVDFFNNLNEASESYLRNNRTGFQQYWNAWEIGAQNAARIADCVLGSAKELLDTEAEDIARLGRSENLRELMDNQTQLASNIGRESMKQIQRNIETMLQCYDDLSKVMTNAAVVGMQVTKAATAASSKKAAA